MLAPWMTPSATRVAWYACSAFDTPTPTSTGMSVIAFRRAARAVAVSASDVAFAGHAEQPHRVEEPTRPSSDPRQPIVGRGRRGEHDRLDARGVGGLAPRPRLLQREVGQDRRR